MIPYIIATIEDLSDREFMSQLYIQYEKLMYSEAGKITRDLYLTEDVVQESLIKLIGKIQLLRTLPERKLVNYIISTLKNTAITSLKQKKQKDILNIEDYINTGFSNYSRTIEGNIIFHDDLKSLAHIWPKLDSRCRYLLEARYILNKSSAEIAEDLGIKPASVRMALVRARQQALHLIEN